MDPRFANWRSGEEGWRRASRSVWGHLSQMSGTYHHVNMDMDLFPSWGVWGGGHHEVYGASCRALSQFESRYGPISPLGCPGRASRSVWGHSSQTPGALSSFKYRYGSVSRIEGPGRRASRSVRGHLSQTLEALSSFRSRNEPISSIVGLGRRASRSVWGHLSRSLRGHLYQTPVASSSFIYKWHVCPGSYKND